MPISREKNLKHDDFALKKYLEDDIVIKSRKTKSRRFKISKTSKYQRKKLIFKWNVII